MKSIRFLSFILLSMHVSAQNEVSTLYFGKTILDFRYEPPLILTTQAKDPIECAASICDEQGNLLFYSNGGVSPTGPWEGGVFAPNNTYMQNGHFVDSGGCVSSFQGAIVLPDPQGITPTNRKYYLFTKDCLESSFSTTQYNSGLTYSIIDMNANGGQGSVSTRYNVVVPYHIISGHKSNYEPVTVVLDSEGEVKSGTPGYWIFSYTDDSLYHIHFGVNGFNQFQKLVGGEGALVVAPDRTHMAVGNILYRLDPVLGTVQYRETLASNAEVAFSSDGTKLYMITGTSLKQYDLDQPNLLSTEYTIATIAANSNILLAPSKRILLFQSSSNFIDAEIVCTNNVGMSCGWDPTNIVLGSTALTPNSGKPNIPAHYLYGANSTCHLGIKEEQATDFSIFPNPSNGNFVVQINPSSTNKFTLSIVDLAGRIVRTKQISALSENNQLEIQATDLQKGNYFLVLNSEEGLPVTKVFLIE